MNQLEGRRILLAEDEEMNRAIARSVLELAGATVIEAIDGQDALDLFLAKEDPEPELIILDVGMPKKNGYEVCEAIRHSKMRWATKVPIYALTADIMCNKEGKWRKAGMNGVLEKPIDYRDVLEILG